MLKADKLRWLLTRNRKFTVNSLYNKLQNPAVDDNSNVVSNICQVVTFSISFFGNLTYHKESKFSRGNAFITNYQL